MSHIFLRRGQTAQQTGNPGDGTYNLELNILLPQGPHLFQHEDARRGIAGDGKPLRENENLYQGEVILPGVENDDKGR